MAEEERRRKLQKLHDEASVQHARQAAIQQGAGCRNAPTRLRESAARQVTILIQQALQSFDVDVQLDATSQARRTKELSCLASHENFTFCCRNTGKALKADTLGCLRARVCCTCRTAP